MNQPQVEQLRWAALEYLACRSTCAFAPDQVKRGLDAAGVPHMLGVRIEESQVAAALQFLTSEGLANAIYPSMSAMRAYQVTSRGTLAWERKAIDQEG